MRRIIVPLGILFMFSAASRAGQDMLPSVAIADEFLTDATVRAIFGEVLRQGGLGRRNTESAAFLIREETGEYRCVAWPVDGGFRRQRFTGTIPDRTVAIVHTHPEASRSGSVVDQKTAISVGIPIFVLTRRNIYVVTAGGENVPIVLGKMWMPKRDAQSRCTGSLPHALVQDPADAQALLESDAELVDALTSD